MLIPKEDKAQLAQDGYKKEVFFIEVKHILTWHLVILNLLDDSSFVRIIIQMIPLFNFFSDDISEFPLHRRFHEYSFIRDYETTSKRKQFLRFKLPYAGTNVLNICNFKYQAF